MLSQLSYLIVKCSNLVIILIQATFDIGNYSELPFDAFDRSATGIHHYLRSCVNSGTGKADLHNYEIDVDVPIVVSTVFGTDLSIHGVNLIECIY